MNTSDLLVSLRDQLDEIAEIDDRAGEFLENLIIQLEEGRDFDERPLSDRQADWLADIYDRWC